MLDVVAMGELLIDFTCQSTDADGYPTMAAHPGGGPANFLAALSKFGARTAQIGKVGNDAFGRMLLGTLEKAGIETGGMIMADDVFTTLAFVTLDESGDRSFSFARKPGADTCLKPEEVKLSLIDEARAFHFGTLPLTDEPSASAARMAVDYAKKAGKLLVFDPNLRKPLWDSLDRAAQAMKWGLQQADVVKISDEEVEFLFGMGVREGAEHILKEYGVKLVFVTCGGDGCWFQNAVAQGHVPALSGITVADTTGAGDIFGGSATYQLLQRNQPPEALNETELRDVVSFACTAAGLSTTKQGGVSSVPTLEEVEERRKNHVAQH